MKHKKSSKPTSKRPFAKPVSISRKLKCCLALGLISLGVGLFGLGAYNYQQEQEISRKKLEEKTRREKLQNTSNAELASWLFSLPRDLSVRIFNSALAEVEDLELFSEWGRVALETKVKSVYDPQIEMNGAVYGWFDDKIYMGKMNPLLIVNFMLEKGSDEGRTTYFHENLHALQHRNSKYYKFMKFLGENGTENKIDFTSKKLNWKLNVTPEILDAFSKDYLKASSDERTIVEIFKRLSEEVGLYCFNSIPIFEAHSYLATKPLSKKELCDTLKREKYDVKSERQIENCWDIVNAAYSLFDNPHSAEAHMQVATMVGRNAHVYDAIRETYPSLEAEINKISEKRGKGKNYVANFDEKLVKKRYVQLEETQNEVKRKVREKLLEEYAFIKGF